MTAIDVAATLYEHLTGIAPVPSPYSNPMASVAGAFGLDGNQDAARMFVTDINGDDFEVSVKPVRR